MPCRHRKFIGDQLSIRSFIKNPRNGKEFFGKKNDGASKDAEVQQDFIGARIETQHWILHDPGFRADARNLVK